MRLGPGALVGWVEGWDDVRRLKRIQYISEDWGEQGSSLGV